MTSPSFEPLHKILHKILERNGLDEPDGRPLYKYRVKGDELRRLGHSLMVRVAGSGPRLRLSLQGVLGSQLGPCGFSKSSPTVIWNRLRSLVPSGLDDTDNQPGILSSPHPEQVSMSTSTTLEIASELDRRVTLPELNGLDGACFRPPATKVPSCTSTLSPGDTSGNSPSPGTTLEFLSFNQDSMGKRLARIRHQASAIWNGTAGFGLKSSSTDESGGLAG